MINKIETSTKHFNKFLEILGENYIKSKIESPFDFIRIAGKGINANVINNSHKRMSIPNPALGGMQPKKLAEISGCVSEVKDLFGRIEHGVYNYIINCSRPKYTQVKLIGQKEFYFNSRLTNYNV
ncbi:MAG: hypothetical protein U9R19_06875 [Bacteroidota bacterium]|nr:hypothetical protein [Bacteroidota bacterium]